MSNMNKPSENQGNGAQAPDSEESKVVASSSRRKLIKLGTLATPVIATLTSKQALAWHCQSPSAWGSEQLNPNTSLKTNQGHQYYPDETWTVTNWSNNSNNSSGAAPWTQFFINNPTIKSSVGGNYQKVKISMLSGITIPSGVSTTAYVYKVLGTGTGSGTIFQKTVIVAQLNFMTTPPSALNQMSQCLNLNELKQMASGSFTAGGKIWTSNDIINYLQTMWFAAP